MVYQSNIPLATDNLSKSQVDINGDFTWLGAIAGNGTNNSSSVNSISNGFNYIFLPVNGANPPVGTAFNVTTASALYTALFPAGSPGTNKNELYVSKQINGSQTQIPMTASILSNTTPGSLAPGYTYLPSGIIHCWGNTTVSTAGTLITLPITFPTQILNIQLTPSGLGGGANITGQVSMGFGGTIIVSLNQFRAIAQGANPISTYYFVTGY